MIHTRKSCLACRQGIIRWVSNEWGRGIYSLRRSLKQHNSESIADCIKAARIHAGQLAGSQTGMADDNLLVILLAASCERYVSGPLETM